MMLRIRSAICLTIAGWLLLAGVAVAQDGVILDQQLDGTNRGYTVLRLWGSHYEMGYAQASLLGDYIVDGVDELKDLVGDQQYDALWVIMAASVWKPPEIEDELDGMVDSLAITHPSASIDKVDLKRVSQPHLLGALRRRSDQDAGHPAAGFRVAYAHIEPSRVVCAGSRRRFAAMGQPGLARRRHRGDRGERVRYAGFTARLRLLWP
jgi:hypothetical protein